MPEHKKVKTQNSFKWFCLSHSSQSSLIIWLFVERPQVVGVTSEQDVCEHSEVTLSCNATGKPEPNITWTRVSENGTDSEELQSKDGYLVMANISPNSNGTYRCTAFNGVGEPVNQTVKVIVRCKLSRLCNVSFKLIKFSISPQYQTFFSYEAYLAHSDVFLIGFGYKEVLVCITFTFCYQRSEQRKSIYESLKCVSLRPTRRGTGTKDNNRGRWTCDKGMQSGCWDSSTKWVLEDC